MAGGHWKSHCTADTWYLVKCGGPLPDQMQLVGQNPGVEVRVADGGYGCGPAELKPGMEGRLGNSQRNGGGLCCRWNPGWLNVQR